MTFATSLQSLVSTYATITTTPCSVNWQRGLAYRWGGPHSGDFRFSILSISSGLELANKLDSSYSPHIPASSVPIGLDGSGNVYLYWSSLNGGGLIQIDPLTLAQIGYGGTASPPPDGWALAGGKVSGFDSGGANFIIATGIGGTTQAGHVIFNGLTFAGRYENWPRSVVTTSNGFCCGGKIGDNCGFVVAGPGSDSAVPQVTVYRIDGTPGGSWTAADWPTLNPLVTSTIIASIAPTDIDASWTTIAPNGCCVDQTDGNLIIPVVGDTGATTYLYIIKVDKTTGAVIWAAHMASRSALGGRTLAFSSITNQRIGFVNPTHFATVASVQILDTSDGSTVDTYTTGLGGMQFFGEQCYNDSRGALCCNCTIVPHGDAPTLLNSTPSTFNGWGILYIAPAPPPPPGSRRYLAQCGPIRGASAAVTDGIRITESGDTRITMEADIRVILP